MNVDKNESSENKLEFTEDIAKVYVSHGYLNFNLKKYDK